MNNDLKNAGKISFKFDGIPKGTYCIITFQDVNMNQNFDPSDEKKPEDELKLSFRNTLMMLFDGLRGK